MMCYRDRTFCNDSDKCSNGDCEYRFTKEDDRLATKWWGSTDYPLAMSEYHTDNCGFIKKETK